MKLPFWNSSNKDILIKYKGYKLSKYNWKKQTANLSNEASFWLFSVSLWIRKRVITDTWDGNSVCSGRKKTIKLNCYVHHIQIGTFSKWESDMHRETNEWRCKTPLSHVNISKCLFAAFRLSQLLRLFYVVVLTQSVQSKRDYSSFILCFFQIF